LNAETRTKVSDDVNSLLRLLDEHGAELLALLTRLTLRADVAEDLLQELFLKLRDAAGFARAHDPKAYALRTAANLAFDWRRTRRPTEPLRTDPPAPARSPLDGMVDAEEFDEILDVLQALPGLSRDVLVMRFLEHQEYAEIAERLGKTEHQVRGLCAKALRQLRSTFRPAVSDPDRGGSQQ
jgi:RNA polymerase sigma factor (sigma-70 family)